MEVLLLGATLLSGNLTTKGKKFAEAWTSGSEHGDSGTHGGAVKGAEKSQNASPAGQKNSPLNPKVNAANAKREVGFLPFNVFAEYTRRRIAVPQVMLREEIKSIQAKISVPFREGLYPLWVRTDDGQ